MTRTHPKARRYASVCTEPGCPVIVTDLSRNRCPDHLLEFNRERDAHRGTRTERGLSNRWLRLRDRVVADHVAAHGWVCPGFERPAHAVAEGELTGDHIVPRNVAPDRALDPLNVAVLCLSCNSAKGAKTDAAAAPPPPKPERRDWRRSSGTLR